MLYAGLGVIGAEFLLLGIRQIGQFQTIRIVVELCLFFVACAILLDPVGEFLAMRIAHSGRQSPILTELAESRGKSEIWVASGITGVAVALVFIGFNLTVAGAFSTNGTSIWFYSFVHVLMPLLIPGIVTFAWIAGNRKPYRAALYGALAGFFTDALARLIVSSATGSIVANHSLPLQAISGGIQAGFYGGVGGLFLDVARSQRPLQKLILGLFGAVGLWTLGYWIIGGSVGLPYADLPNQFHALVERLVDYGGWVFGLALYPNFEASFQNAQVLPARSGIVVLRVALFAPAVITCDILIFAIGFHKNGIQSSVELWGLILGILSGLAWQLSTVTTISSDLWGRVLNIGAGMCAIGSAAFLASAAT